MTKRIILAASAVGVALVGGLAVAPTAGAAPTLPATRPVKVCATEVAGQYRCLAVALAASDGKVHGSPVPSAAAFGPAQIQAAYGLGGKKSNGRTVAIVDAYGYPNLAKDLAKFRSHYNLPPCTVANGCLKIVGQDGGAPPTQTDSGWELEQALDVDSVSAACPDCKILVVQGDAPTFADLGQAVNTAAAAPGVVAISNSYGTGASVANKSYFKHRNIAVVASTGDGGYQSQGSYPANDTYVVAVGGTTVKKTSSGYTETVWNGAGSGCGVSGNPRPAWQNGSTTTCGNIDAGADVSAAADPSFGGLNVYDSGQGGFVQVGGTSEASPIIAAVFALSGHTSGFPGQYLWAHANSSNMHDVTAGTNGSCGVPLCKARAGWDGPTGLGTPKGVGAF